MSCLNDNFLNKETMKTNSTKVSKVNIHSNNVEEQSTTTYNECNTSNLEFTRENIEKLGTEVNLVDTDKDTNLDMFCYVKCCETDSSLLKQCRGVVFNGNNIIMKAFPYTTEYSHLDTENIKKTFENLSKWIFFEAHEGALLRVFYYKKWYVSTHRKLNAFRSKWASKESFGTSFKNALLSEEENNKDFKNRLKSGDNILDRFQDTLDTNNQYMFLIRNTKENRIVSNPPERPTVYHVGTFVNNKLVFDINIDIPTPDKLKFANINELQEYVGAINYKDVQGVIGFTSDNTQVKIVNDDYRELFKVRGNEPSIKFRYLQIRMNRRYVNMMYYLYPEMADTFDEYENTLYDIARSIYRAYVQRFIKKRYVTVPGEEFAVIRECHMWHLEDRTTNSISLSQVIKVLNQQLPTHLNHMIRRFKLERIKQLEQKNTTHRPRADSVRSEKSFEQSPAIRKIIPTVLPPSPLILSENVVHKQKNIRHVTRLLNRN